jgi:hypothetical protein
MTVDEARRLLEVVGARPSDEDLDLLLPLLTSRLAAWKIARSEDLDDVAPAFIFRPEAPYSS